MARPRKQENCQGCKFFDGFCKHKKNTIIEISKKIETLTYKDTKTKTKCEFYENV